MRGRREGRKTSARERERRERESNNRWHHRFRLFYANESMLAYSSHLCSFDRVSLRSYREHILTRNHREEEKEKRETGTDLVGVVSFFECRRGRNERVFGVRGGSGGSSGWGFNCSRGRGHGSAAASGLVVSHRRRQTERGRERQREFSLSREGTTAPFFFFLVVPRRAPLPLSFDSLDHNVELRKSFCCLIVRLPSNKLPSPISLLDLPRRTRHELRARPPRTSGCGGRGQAGAPSSRVCTLVDVDVEICPLQSPSARRLALLFAASAAASFVAEDTKEPSLGALCTRR